MPKSKINNSFLAIYDTTCHSRHIYLCDNGNCLISMETLFSTDKRNLKQLFDVLEEDEVQECCSPQAYNRGVDYFENGYVRSAEYNSDKTLFTAKVRGSHVYAVQVSLENGKVQAACTCLQDAICKHIVAAMLYGTVENVDTQVSSTNSSLDMRKYLTSLSKEELVELLINHAHDDFFTTINNKHSAHSEAAKIFSKGKRTLEDIFGHEELLNDPDLFEESLMKVLKTLSGLESKMPKKLGELIVYIIRKVEKATDEGYLYNHYTDYNFEPGEQFYEFIERLTCAMDFHDKTEFIEQLESVISSSSYSTFHGAYSWLGKGFTDRELPQLKTLLVNEYKYLPEAVVESYYCRVSSILSDNEKEKILDVLDSGNDSRTVELAELLSKNGKRKKSILMLRQAIFRRANEFIDEKLCILYLDQMKAENLDLHDAVRKCMKQCPNESMLRKVTELLPTEVASCEEILEERRPEELLNYLESMERHADALSLIKRNNSIWRGRVLIFYKRNKKKFPEEAGQFFSDTINENLRNTGYHYYHTIADALKHLKQIDKETAHELTLHLRQNYRRRSKLMAMIENT